MSGASMNEIKARMKSVRSTMQITRAMELVATSKLRRARVNAENAEAFCRGFERSIGLLMGAAAGQDSVWSREGESEKVLYIVIAGDRGLAGGYNSNVFRLAAAVREEQGIVLPWGKKAVDFYSHEGIELFAQGADVSELDMSHCMQVARQVCDGFREGRFGRVELIYTRFVSMLSQLPARRTLLPLDGGERGDSLYDAVTDSDRDGLIDLVMPEYVGTLLYCGVCQSAAAESAARRTAMSSANKNAEEMIDSLTLNYNRARQAVITGEITEIVSGAGAP